MRAKGGTIRNSLLIGLALIAIATAKAGEVTKRTLSFEDRVVAQYAIEQVYWSHRLWPKENQTPKPALATVLSDDALRAKVKLYLEKSNALEALWKHPINAVELQAELDRMARDSRDPKMLQEMFDALHGDPFVIAETLARQTLADRLVRSWYANDGRFHDAARKKAESALDSCHETACMTAMGASYSESTRQRDDEGASALPVQKLGRLEETEESFAVTALLDIRRDRITTASVTWPKKSFDAWWSTTSATFETRVAEPVGGYSTPTIALSACTVDRWSPTQSWIEPRESHVSVWTGTEMIVWGGLDGSGRPLNTGGRYNPSTDTWVPTSTGTNVPAARAQHTAVWTGTEMIIWGGSRVPGDYLSDGGRYDPQTDSWLPTSNGSGVPTAREKHTAVWTGAEMIVWGGFPSTNSGGRYRPSTDAWSATTSSGAPIARYQHTAVWTGSELVVWGGTTGTGQSTRTGGRYNPSTDSWIATSVGANVPEARSIATAVWTGNEMIVWGGATVSAYLQSGARYDPSTDSWLPTSTGANTPTPRASHTAIWTGTEMIVWGGANALQNSGARYNPSNDSWQATALNLISPTARYDHTAVWTGTEMIVWGGRGAGADLNTGGRYDPFNNSWVPTSVGGNVPSPRTYHTAVWTGAEMIVWGGLGVPQGLNSGGRYDPSTDSWTRTSLSGDVPSLRDSHTAIWTGTEMIVWGGRNQVPPLNTGGRYQPATDSWRSTSTGMNAPSARMGHSAVWSGTAMVIWGGVEQGGGLTNTGGRYDPTTDMWSPTSLGTGVPAPRSGHGAVWTGNEMIVWGGKSSPSFPWVVLGNGGRYDPSLDSWTPTSTGANTPEARVGHSVVWTGSEMIVWGGEGQSGSQLRTGGRYSPAADSWVATSIGQEVPAKREYHSAVWTGAEMIVWGGVWGGSDLLDSGGRYNPSTDAWRSTSIGANIPSPRASQTAVWTGIEMIVWGGTPDYDGYLNSGGRYCACSAPQLVYRDADGDGYGDPAASLASCAGMPPPGYVLDHTDCDDGAPNISPSAIEACDGVDNDCDGLVDETVSGEDPDGDTVRSACDNCPLAPNVAQSDFDHDGEGDACDLNDGWIYLDAGDPSQVEWQAESGYTSWNRYRGSLSVLRATGVYTQEPGSSPLVSRDCSLGDPAIFDPFVPDSGEVAFNLVTGISGGLESSLGTNSEGVLRENANPCP